MGRRSPFPDQMCRLPCPEGRPRRRRERLLVRFVLGVQHSGSRHGSGWRSYAVRERTDRFLALGSVMESRLLWGWRLRGETLVTYMICEDWR